MMDFDFTQDIVLEDERVLIRPMVETDKPFFMEFLLDPNLNRYSSMQVRHAREALLYVDNCLEDRKKEARYPFIFYDKLKNSYAGTSCFGNVSNPNKRIEIGWTKIGAAFQGTGLNVHCKYLMIQYAFEGLGFNRVELKSHSENIQSRKAMEKIGATFEGLLRQHMIMPNGRLRDTVYYSFLLPEWRETKALLKSLMAE